MNVAAATAAPGGTRHGCPSSAPPRPATWYTIVGGNDVYFRVKAPAKAVGGHVSLLPEEAYERDDGSEEPGGYYAITTPNTDSALPWQMTVDRNDPSHIEVAWPKHEGTAVWTRPDLWRARHAAMMQANGIRTLAEVDDNYLSDTSLNVYLRAMNYSDHDRDTHLKAHAFMDGIVFSTALLRDMYWREMRREVGKKLVPPLFVARNHIPAEDWPARVERDGPLRVGWMGSPSHVWDVDIAWPALMHARNLGCETWMIGYDPANPQESMEVPVGTRSRSLEKRAQWAKVGYRHVRWVKPDDYRRAALPLDIGLCPLRHDQHTLGKSDVKFLEYAVSGAAVIASNMPVYNRTIVHGETGLLVGSPEQMLEAVGLLARDHKLRERLAANAAQYVREERNGDVMRHEWMEAING